MNDKGNPTLQIHFKIQFLRRLKSRKSQKLRKQQFKLLLTKSHKMKSKRNYRPRSY